MRGAGRGPCATRAGAATRLDASVYLQGVLATWSTRSLTQQRSLYDAVLMLADQVMNGWEDLELQLQLVMQ